MMDIIIIFITPLLYFIVGCFGIILHTKKGEWRRNLWVVVNSILRDGLLC